jgi:2-keto-4-pentenoate hydratase
MQHEVTDEIHSELADEVLVPMEPKLVLQHYDNAQLWPTASNLDSYVDVPSAYQCALAVRAMRVARGEVPRGYKIGFTNRSIWPRYGVNAPIWGTVYDTTLSFCDERGTLRLEGLSQPRIEPEVVFALRATPPAGATLFDLFNCLDWVAPGFEIVQSHHTNWKFAAADAVADGSLHARLLVGAKVPVRGVAATALALCAALATTSVRLSQDAKVVDSGAGAAVLDDPLQALLHFVHEIQLCPGAPSLQAGDVITTGTLTDAWPVKAGQTWAADFDTVLLRIEVAFS